LNKYQLTMLAKYFVSLGYTGKKLENSIIEFCQEHYGDFNIILYRDLIKNVILISKKYRLRKTDPVIITKKEIDLIRQCPAKTGKMLFAMLVLAKNAKNSNIIRKDNYTENDNYFCYYSFNVQCNGWLSHLRRST